MAPNFLENYFGIKEKYWSKNHRRGTPGGAQPTRVRHPLLARQGGCCPPGGPADPNSDAINSHLRRKKSRRKNYRVSRDGVAATSCSSSGGQIWSPFGAPERGSSSFVIINLSPSPIPWCSPPGVSNSFVGSLVGEGVGWDSSCNRVSFVRAWSLVSTMFWDWCCYDLHVLNACH